MKKICLIPHFQEEESAFVEFIENHEKVELKECEFGRLTSEKAEQVRAKVQEMAISDRFVWKIKINLKILIKFFKI